MIASRKGGGGNEALLEGSVCMIRKKRQKEEVTNADNEWCRSRCL